MLKAFFQLDTGDKRSTKQFINIFISAFLKAGSIFCNFLLVPICLGYLDVESYGIWLTITSVVSWISFLDGGLGNGLKNKLSEALVTDNQLSVIKLISSAYVGIIFIATILLFLFLICVNITNASLLLGTSAYMTREVNLTFLVVLVCFCVKLVFDLINSVLLAFQKVWIVNLIGFLTNFGLLFGVYLITKLVTVDKLFSLALCFSILPILVLAGYNGYFFGIKNFNFRPRLSFFDYRIFKEIISLGGKFFIIQITVIIIFSTDSLIINRLFGAEDVTVYNIALKFFSIFTLAWGIIMSPYWIAFNEAFLKSDFNWVKKTVNMLLKLWIILVMLLIIALIASDYIYGLWIGTKIKIPFLLSSLMALFVAISTLSNIFTYFINGVGKVRVQLIASIIAGLINLPLIYFFSVILKLGISGVILATCVSLMSGPVLAYFQYKAIIKGNAKGIWLK